MDLADATSKILSFRASVDASVFAQDQEKLRLKLQKARQHLAQHRSAWTSFENTWSEKSAQVQQDMLDKVIQWCSLMRGPEMLGIGASDWQRAHALFSSLVGSGLLSQAPAQLLLYNEPNQEQFIIVVTRAFLRNDQQVMQASEVLDRQIVQQQLKLLEQSSGTAGTRHHLSKDAQLINVLVLLKQLLTWMTINGLVLMLEALNEAAAAGSSSTTTS